MFFKYETDRLILRVLNPEEAEKVIDFYYRDKALFEKYEFERIPEFYTTEYQQKILRYEYEGFLKQKCIRFYIFLKDNPDKIIGTVCIHDICRSFYQSCQLGYKFSSEYHHQGYATEALSLIKELVFTDLRLHRIEAYVCIGNTPSQALLDRMNFKEEGILQDYLFIQGRWMDHHLYALLDDKIT